MKHLVANTNCIASNSTGHGVPSGYVKNTSCRTIRKDGKIFFLRNENCGRYVDTKTRCACKPERVPRTRKVKQKKYFSNPEFEGINPDYFSVKVIK